MTKRVFFDKITDRFQSVRWIECDFGQFAVYLKGGDILKVPTVTQSAYSKKNLDALVFEIGEKVRGSK